MTTQEAIPPPPVMWAQRSQAILLTINLEDCKNPEIKIEKDSVYFKGVGGTEVKLYEVRIPLLHEIDPELSKYSNRGRCIEMILLKAKSDAPYWPSLTSDKKKHHWLKCDFNKWKDEDESGDETEGLGGGAGGGDFEEMMRQMGGLGGMGGGVGGGGGKPTFDDMDPEDSDEEQLPDLE